MIEIRRGTARTVSRAPGIEAWHSFSAGEHYDPANTHFGRLVAHDEHVLQPGAGFDMHPHRGIDIVSWVLEGTLRHEDSTGNQTTVRPGMVQHLSAGSGVRHAERNGGEDELRFVQMWLLGDAAADPAYRVESSTMLRLDKATLHVVRLSGDGTELPTAPFVHVFVSRGAVALGGEALAAGDSARIAPCDGMRAGGDGEVLIVQMRADATA